MAADTSSPAATTTPVVEDAAAALAALMVEPRLAKSVAAEPNTSGAATTNDICEFPTGHDRSSPMPPASGSLTSRN